MVSSGIGDDYVGSTVVGLAAIDYCGTHITCSPNLSGSDPEHTFKARYPVGTPDPFLGATV